MVVLGIFLGGLQCVIEFVFEYQQKKRSRSPCLSICPRCRCYDAKDKPYLPLVTFACLVSNGVVAVYAIKKTTLAQASYTMGIAGILLVVKLRKTLKSCLKSKDPTRPPSSSTFPEVELPKRSNAASPSEKKKDISIDIDPSGDDESKKTRVKGDSDTKIDTKALEKTSFFGMINQGATCYMSAILQSLFHLRSFRKVVYKMPAFIPDGSISMSLLSIFYDLERSGKSVSTKTMTEVLKWGCNLSEFKDKLFEMLASEMQVIGEHGVAVSGHLSEIQDIPLVVKGCGTVYASFDKLDAEERGLLCNCPRVLLFRLLRLDEDNRGDKINDHYVFPRQLDLINYMPHDLDDGSVSKSYALHSILVHKGVARHGHYYAFIRPYLNDQWFKFDDESVTEVEEETVFEEAYGGSEGMLSDTNAYLLLYVRESDKEDTMCPVGEGDIDENLKERLMKSLDENNFAGEEMKVIAAAAYLLAVSGGNTTPSAEDLKSDQNRIGAAVSSQRQRCAEKLAEEKVDQCEFVLWLAIIFL